MNNEYSEEGKMSLLEKKKKGKEKNGTENDSASFEWVNLFYWQYFSTGQYFTDNVYLYGALILSI